MISAPISSIDGSSNFGAFGKTPIKIAFLSAGLGNIYRGFEISASTWYEQMKSEAGVFPELFSGAKVHNGLVVWNLPRNGKIAKLLRSFGFINDGCRLEQLTFSIGFLLKLIRYRPDIIWLQESTLAAMLLKYKNFFGFNYKIIFCDGAPVGYVLAKKFDYQIFLHQSALDEAINLGANPSNCRLIPHICQKPMVNATRSHIRKALEIGEQQFVVICVAAWNTYHKRIDYLLQEVSVLDGDDVLLLLCGQAEAETPYLKQLAAELKVNVRWHTFTQTELSSAYLAADVFVLPSLNEGLGAVLIEAGLHGLPIICHPHTSAKYVLGTEYPGLTDLSKPGALHRKISAYQRRYGLNIDGICTKMIIENKFDRERLSTEFSRFVRQVCSA